jgi:hypothetical protein
MTLIPTANMTDVSRDVMVPSERLNSPEMIGRCYKFMEVPVNRGTLPVFREIWLSFRRFQGSTGKAPASPIRRHPRLKHLFRAGFA